MSDEQLYPLELFDPDTEPIPSGSLEIQLDCPTSLGLIARYYEQQENQQGIDTIYNAYVYALSDILMTLQEKAGYGAPRLTARNRAPIRIRLSATAVFHMYSKGANDMPRPHAHIYVGKSGRHQETGLERPLDTDVLERQISQMNAAFQHDLVAYTTSYLKVRWQDFGGFHELVEPPLADIVPDILSVECEGDFRANVRYSVSITGEFWRSINSFFRSVG